MTETISHYRIVRELGRGGMGQVYLAEDTRLHRMVALKLLAPDVVHDQRRRQRFLREAHAASIVSHPNIAVIHEIGETADSAPFIAMEYVEGRTLDEVIGDRPLPLNQIPRVTRRLRRRMELRRRRQRQSSLTSFQPNQNG